MMRLAPIPPEQMSPAQLAVRDASLAGQRGRMPAPLGPWLRSPTMAQHAQRLGESIRFELSLSPRLVALAALSTAAHWQATYVLQAQAEKARAAGVPGHVINRVASRQDIHEGFPEAAALSLVHLLLMGGPVSDTAYTRALAELGERGLVELVAVVGYYGLVSMTDATFGIAADPVTQQTDD